MLLSPPRPPPPWAIAVSESLCTPWTLVPATHPPKYFDRARAIKLHDDAAGKSLPGELEERWPEIIRIRQIAGIGLLHRSVLLQIRCHVRRVLRVQFVLRAWAGIGSEPPIYLVFLLGADVDL